LISRGPVLKLLCLLLSPRTARVDALARTAGHRRIVGSRVLGLKESAMNDPRLPHVPRRSREARNRAAHSDRPHRRRSVRGHSSTGTRTSTRWSGHPVLRVGGAFTPDGEFLQLPELDRARLQAAWQEAVFALYLAEEKIEPEVVENMRTSPHSGCSVDQSVFLAAGDRAGIERLVGYMTRCPFSLSRLVQVTATGQVIYKAEKVCGRSRLLVHLLIFLFPTPIGSWTMRAELRIDP